MNASDEQLSIPIGDLWKHVADVLNNGLLGQHGKLDDGVTPRYQFEFVDSQEVNGMAIEFGGVGFLGITVPLRTKLWEICFDLSRSAPIAKRFNASTIEQCQALQVELFTTVLGFVVCHEYGHHVLSHHVHSSKSETFYSDVINGLGGSIDVQGKEIHADGYAVYLVIAGLIAGDRREQITKSLGEEVTTDELLLCLFIASVAAFFFIGEPKQFDSQTVESLTHPPAAIRLNYVMYHMKRWCSESRENLLRTLTLALFQELIRDVK